MQIHRRQQQPQLQAALQLKAAHPGVWETLFKHTSHPAFHWGKIFN